MLDDLRARLEILTQTCVLAHVTTTLELIARGTPVDLAFQSIGGTEALNRSFGIDLALLDEALDATRALQRGEVGNNVMYFETGQGSALSANAHHGVDQQTLEARAYAVARRYEPLLVNTVAGFIGLNIFTTASRSYARASKIIFAASCSVCRWAATSVTPTMRKRIRMDMDALLTLLAAAGVNFVMGVPGADDVMLGYR